MPETPVLSLTRRQDFMLAVLSSLERTVSFTPVQLQKLFFLIDREASGLVEGPHFNFVAYDYGPFDRAVYDELDYLAGLSLVHIIPSGRYRVYAPSANGLSYASKEFARLSPIARSYIQRCAEWVRSLNFQQLVTAIYNHYPDMKKNSIFQE